MLDSTVLVRFFCLCLCLFLWWSGLVMVVVEVAFYRSLGFSCCYLRLSLDCSRLAVGVTPVLCRETLGMVG
jgi:hypothetical protein